MIECDRLSFFLPAQHVFCQDLVLLEKDRKILLRQRAGTVRRRDYRFHGQFRKPEIICHVEDIIGEIGVEMRVSAAHVIALLSSGIREFLKQRDYAVITSLSFVIDPEPVVYLFPAVEAQYHVVALLIGPLDHFISDAHAVCSQSEAEILFLLFLYASGVSDQLLADLEIHQRLSAKKVHFQILSKA